MSRFSNPSTSLLASAAAITVASMFALAAPLASASELPKVESTTASAPSRTVPTTGGSTFDNHTNGWYDGLVDYLKPYHSGENMGLPGVDLHDASEYVANQRNMRDQMIPAITLITDESLRNKLLAHAAGITDQTFRKAGEFKLSFSKDRTVSSAASEFFSLVRQAGQTAKSEVEAEHRAN